MEVDAVTSINARLAIGTVGETVNVTAEAPLLKAEKADVSDTMTQRAVQELPVFGRDMSRLYFLVPGVQATGTSAPSEQPHDIFRPTIGGQYWGGISFQLDGTDNRDSVLGEPVITPNLDSVAELKITTTSYDAEFGQASQAIIASAHQVRHATRCTAASSNTAATSTAPRAIPSPRPSPSSAPTASSSRPRCGTSSAARSAVPSRRTRHFIFGDYQANRQHNGASLLTRVPTAAERAGDLSGLNTPIFQPLQRHRLQHPPAAPPAVRRQRHPHEPALAAGAESAEVDSAAQRRRRQRRGSQLRRRRPGRAQQRFLQRARRPLPDREAPPLRPLQLHEVRAGRSRRVRGCRRRPAVRRRRIRRHFRRSATRASPRASTTPSARPGSPTSASVSSAIACSSTPTASAPRPPKTPASPASTSTPTTPPACPTFALNGTGGFSFGYSLAVNSVQLPAERAGERIPVGQQHHPRRRQSLPEVRRRLALRAEPARAQRFAPLRPAHLRPHHHAGSQRRRPRVWRRSCSAR